MLKSSLVCHGPWRLQQDEIQFQISNDSKSPSFISVVRGHFKTSNKIYIQRRWWGHRLLESITQPQGSACLVQRDLTTFSTSLAMISCGLTPHVRSPLVSSTNEHSTVMKCHCEPTCSHVHQRIVCVAMVWCGCPKLTQTRTCSAFPSSRTDGHPVTVKVCLLERVFLEYLLQW
jgi:hypothetical protein